MKKVFIFGNNYLSEILWFYLQEEGKRVDGFVLNKQYVGGNKHQLPATLYAIEDVIEWYGAENISVYLTIGNTQMNKVREKIFNELESHGIEICSYIHPSASVASNVKMGQGNIILEKCVVQPFVKLGHANIMWSGSIVGHHSTIGNFNYIAGGANVAGVGNVGNNCFFGNGVTMVDHISIGSRVFVGASVFLNKNLADEEVIVAKSVKKAPLCSLEIMELYEGR